MAAGKELRTKIKSVENTKKITKAMEMISVSKMRKAQERMRSARPYSEKIRNIASNLGQANPEYVHSFMKTNGGKATGFIVVTTDKGLCGGLNTNSCVPSRRNCVTRKTLAARCKLWPWAARAWAF